VARSAGPNAPGPPPLVPFGLVLHHDGRWTHLGEPFTNRKLRELFDRSVRYLPDAGKYVVQVQRYRGEIEVEEAGFFVRALDPTSGEISLSDGSREPLDVADLAVSGRDGALLCRIKRDLVKGGLPARFDHAAQAEFMSCVETAGEGEDGGTGEAGETGAAVRLGGRLLPLPPL
jgi:hypothetical protein